MGDFDTCISREKRQNVGQWTVVPLGNSYLINCISSVLNCEAFFKLLTEINLDKLIKVVKLMLYVKGYKFKKIH